MSKSRTPISWFGGKGHMTKKLVSLFPAHRVYVEVFGGGAACLFAKPPAGLEVYNDLDSGLVGFFRVLRDAEKWKELQRLASLTPFAREEYNYCRAHWQEQEDPVKRAWMWFVVARWSFGGRFGGGFSTVTNSVARGMGSCNSTWLQAIDCLEDFHARIMRVQIEQQDFRTVFDRYDSPDTFFYVDPPYVQSTRKSGSYKHEINDADQEDLVSILLNLKGRAMLSGYPNVLYDRLLLNGWEYREWETVCHAAGRTRASNTKGTGSVLKHQRRTEAVWMNYNSACEIEIPQLMEASA